MSQLLIVFICLSTGFGLRRSSKFNGQHIGDALNAVVIYVALPALTITQIHKMTFSASIILAAAMPWISFGCAVAWSAALGYIMKWQRELTGMMALTTGLGNTSFLGFPLIEAILGKDGLPTAIVSDQLGSFAVVSTVGILVAGVYGRDADSSLSQILRRVVTFPPFIATCVAFATRGLDIPEQLTVALDRIGLILTPLALMSVGSRVDFDGQALRNYWKALSIGLTLKMLISPFIAMLIISALSTGQSLSHKVIILEAAMPSMITGYLIGAEHKLDAKFGALMVTMGILLAMITVTLWGR